MLMVVPKGKLKFLGATGGGGHTWSLSIYSSVIDMLCDLVHVTCSPMLGFIYKFGDGNLR